MPDVLSRRKRARPIERAFERCRLDQHHLVLAYELVLPTLRRALPSRSKAPGTATQRCRQLTAGGNGT
jgi:hypothetical protein